MEKFQTPRARQDALLADSQKLMDAAEAKGRDLTVAEQKRLEGVT